MRIKQEWDEDVQKARKDETIAKLTFDLEKALETPKLSTNIAYYKRQLWTYNLCIYDEVENKGIYDFKIYIFYSLKVSWFYTT